MFIKRIDRRNVASEMDSRGFRLDKQTACRPTIKHQPSHPRKGREANIQMRSAINGVRLRSLLCKSGEVGTDPAAHLEISLLSRRAIECKRTNHPPPPPPCFLCWVFCPNTILVLSASLRCGSQGKHACSLSNLLSLWALEQPQSHAQTIPVAAFQRRTPLVRR